MTAAPARRGRPRSETIDAAVLAATVDELIERGFGAMTMESVAERAGVAKTTVYRRHPDLFELTLAAMRSLESDQVVPPDGTVREQLRWLLDSMRRKWGDPRYAAMMRRASADGGAHLELYREARRRIVGPHVDRMNAVLRRGVAEGLIRADVELPWVRSLLVAPILAAALTHRGRVTGAQLELTLDTVLRGLAP